MKTMNLLTLAMRWNGRIIILLLLLVSAACQSDKPKEITYKTANEIHLIPAVTSLKLSDGYFSLNKDTKIIVFNDSTKGAKRLQTLISAASNFAPEIIQIEYTELSNYSNYIYLDINHKSISNEGYSLIIDSARVSISGMSNEAVGHGIQTLRQLFIDDFFEKKKRETWYLPTLKISDMPKFQHRGMLLDCARHFFEKSTIFKYIDLLEFYKMNVLHWHLTEDQGWRIEIDAFPKLTEVGAWRTEADGERYGGFYTKEDIREIIAYAAERNITIIPEIELPGHAQAAIASYPHLSCTGETVEVANDWGVFKEIYCAGNDSVFAFLETVLTEVIELFPSEYIHIGGDEAPKYRWEHCRKCQLRMKLNGLHDEHELQSYFIQRIEKFLNSKGKKLIGWDEILEGGLSPNATVQSWRGVEGGIAAANANQYAIMSPTSHCYFDYDLKSIDLKKVYSFNPIPSELAEEKYKYILGGECNLWSEHIPDEATLNEKVFPRMLAMAEVLWSASEKKDYPEFIERVQRHLKYLDCFGVKYGLESVPGKIKSTVEGKKIIIEGIPGSEGINLQYQWGNEQTNELKPMATKLSLNSSDTLHIQPVKDDEKYGPPLAYIFEYHKGIGAKVNYIHPFAEQYKANDFLTLVDGRIGSNDFKDGSWQGFWESGFEVILEFDELTNVSSFSTHFYQYSNSWIFMPKEVIVEGSSDDSVYTTIAVIPSNTNPKERGKLIEKFTQSFAPTSVKYLKISAKPMEKVPDWHEAAGAGTWLFIDELIVR
jgi:hexosaminidase